VQKFTSGAKIHQVGAFLHQPSKAASIYLKKAKEKGKPGSNSSGGLPFF